MNNYYLILFAFGFIIGGSLSYAAASEVTLTIPDIEICPTGEYLKGFEISGALICEPLPSTTSGTNIDITTCPYNEYITGFNPDGSLICETIPEPQINSDGTVSSFSVDEENKLKIFASKLSSYDDLTHTYIESRFNGVGENIRPSGGQFQIYCDKVDNQNCTFWQTSADGKTAAWIINKDYDGRWEKVFAMTEATNHQDIHFIMYGDNGVKEDGKANLVMTLKEKGVYIQNDYKPGTCRLVPQPDGTVHCLR